MTVSSVCYPDVMLYPPFYDPTKSYYENLSYGPYNSFVDGVVLPIETEACFDFLGYKINYPFGIPAGPLLGSQFIKAAFDKGFDVNVYKTVRSAEFPCHPFPNVLSAKVKGDLTLDMAKKPVVVNADYTEPLSVTNSFGVPSRSVEEWQEDAEQAITMERQGQLMIMSFMGTIREGQSETEFIDDFAKAGELAAQTSAKILEVNLSCPNIGDEGLVCYNLDMTERIAKAIREVIGDRPLILKTGYYRDDADMEQLALITAKYAQAVQAINTISAEIVDESGNQAFSGEKRKRSGICGSAIKWAGLDFVRRFHAIREKRGLRTAIMGVGGVMAPKDFKEYREAGADIVMSATGAMWNPYLAKEIKETYPDA